LKELVATSDVLVENYITGKLAEMGLGFEDCQKVTTLKTDILSLILSFLCFSD